MFKPHCHFDRKEKLFGFLFAVGMRTLLKLDMLSIHKKIVVDDKGNPTEVIVPWDEYQEMTELLGIDLNKEAIEDLMQAKIDRDSDNKDAYIDLESI